VKAIHADGVITQPSHRAPCSVIPAQAGIQ
jgi:hypothetical protein